MSGDGEVWISPFHFFSLAGSLRSSAADPGDLAALVHPEVHHDGADTYLATLITVVANTRDNMARNIDIAGRAFVIAGTQTTTADLVEEGVGHLEALESPYIYDPADGQEAIESTAEQGRRFYDDINAYNGEHLGE